MRLGRADHLTLRPAMALIVALACVLAVANAAGAPAGANAAGAPPGPNAAGAPAGANAVGARTGERTTGAPAPALAPRATPPGIERQVTCATCENPPNLAESPPADRHRT